MVATETKLKPSPRPRTEPAAEPVDESKRSLWRKWLRPKVLAVVVLVLLVAGGAVFGWLRIERLSAAEDARAAALRSGTELATMISTFDAKDPQASVNAVVAHATDKFGAEYRDTSGKLVPVLRQAQASTQGTVLKAAVAESTVDRAVVIAFVDQTVRNTNLKEPRIDRSRMQLTLVRAGDDWRLDEFTLL
ncbi:hypothetical protein [Amycolatopsis anabasis]|uniref:hypothetical protein n=1 Tax=Amycolatopsis anabasis TaxID=1840409 RepID=UPI00131BFD0D|nr:hypothetical protein [Amycolatopsis anabasis]